MANGDGEGFDIPAGTIVLETAVDMKGLERDLDRGVRPSARRAGERAAGSFAEGFEDSNADRVAKGAEKGLSDLAETAEEAGAKSAKAATGVDQLAESSETATKAAGGLGAILLTKLSRGAAHAAAKVGGLLEFGVIALGQGAQNAGQQLKAASRDMEHFGGVTKKTGELIEGTGKAAEETAKKFKALKVAIVTGVISTLVGSVVEANRFEASFNKIQTAVGGTEAELDRLRVQLSNLSAETGQASETVNETFFKTITRMPRLAQDTDKAMKVVRTALEAGATGFTTATQAVETYEAVLQGFNLRAANAQEVSDKLFHTQQRAGVEFDKIASSVGKVAATSDALGGEFEELLALYATMVPTGQTVAEVTTQVRAAIQSMIDPTAEAREEARRLGIDLSAAAIRSKGLIGVIEEIIKVTEGDPEIIAKLFGRQEAQTLLLNLAKRIPKLRRELELMEEAQGEHAETVRTMNDELGRQKDLILGEWGDALRQLGFELRRKFNEPLLSTLKLLREGSDRFTDFWRAGLEATEMQGIMLVPDFDRFGEAMEELRGGRIERTMADVFGPRGDGLSFDTTRAEDRGAVPSPDLPAQLSGSFQAAAVRAEQARLKVEAFRDFLDTGNEEAYERRLEAIQREVNRLVAERVELMAQHGAEAAEIQKLLGLYDRQIERVDILSDEFAELEESLRAVGSRMGAIGDDMPLPPGFSSEDDLVDFASTDFASKLRGLDRRLQQLRDSGASSEEIFVEMQEAMAEAGVTMDDLQESSEGLARVILRKLLRANLPAWFLGFEDGAEGAGEETSKLREDLKEIATFAGGILNVADALGVLGDDARQALQGVQSLVQSLGQTAEEGAGFLGTGLTAGGFLGVLGAGMSLVSGIAGIISPSKKKELRAQQLHRDLQDLRRSVERLKSSIDAQRQALESVPGGLLAQVQEALRQAPDVSGSPSGIQSMLDFFSRLGLDPTQIERITSQLKGDFELLLKAIRGETISGEANFERLAAQFQAFREQVLALDASDAFQDFEGQLARLQTRMELFDIDDPVRRLEEFLDLLLQFGDLPSGIAEQLEGADLGTAEGRSAVLSIIQRLFERIAGGEEGLLGKLTLPQFEELISRIKETLEGAGEEARGGRSEEFTRTRSITEVTGMRMVGVLTTIDFRVAQIVSMMRQGLGLSPTSGIEPVPGAPEMMPAQMGGTSLTVQTRVEQGAIQVSGAGDPAATAAAVRDSLTDEVSEQLASDVLERLRANGVIGGERMLRAGRN